MQPDQICEEVLQKIEAKTVTVEDFNKLIAGSQQNISEARPKGTLERVHRLTRHARSGPIAKHSGRISPIDRITPKAHGAIKNDPRRTIRGRNAADKEGREDEFKEAIEFIKAHKGKSLEECVNPLCAVVDKAKLQKLVLNLMGEPNPVINRDWLHGLRRMLEPYGF